MLFFVSVMQISLAAVMPVSNLMQSNVIEQSSITAIQQAHCREMMSNSDMPMSDMAECMSECECCSNVYATSAVIIDYQPILLKTSLLHNDASLPTSYPISISTSLYRPPINV